MPSLRTPRLVALLTILGGGGAGVGVGLLLLSLLPGLAPFPRPALNAAMSSADAPAIHQITPLLTTDDMDASLRFYRGVLGFTVAMTVPDEAPHDWALLTSGETALQLQTAKSIGDDLGRMEGRPSGSGPMLYIDVDDVEALRQRVEGEAPVVVAMRETFYGTREFGVTDPNGVVLIFAEDLE
jgi:uncharacterized glyoxalase superfamily protein PhnB